MRTPFYYISGPLSQTRSHLLAHHILWYLAKGYKVFYYGPSYALSGRKALLDPHGNPNNILSPLPNFYVMHDFRYYGADLETIFKDHNLPYLNLNQWVVVWDISLVESNEFVSNNYRKYRAVYLSADADVPDYTPPLLHPIYRHYHVDSESHITLLPAGIPLTLAPQLRGLLQKFISPDSPPPCLSMHEIVAIKSNPAFSRYLQTTRYYNHLCVALVIAYTTCVDITKTFLKLTTHTVPHGYETTLEPILPKGTQKDAYGNYYIRVGESNTLFTCHLDTYGQKRQKISHVRIGDEISTDGKTILGADAKAGMTIMLHMIDQAVPGTYYFFHGEEAIGGKQGCVGSTALTQNPEFLKQFKRAIAFDRDGYNSVVTWQLGRTSCSNTFAATLAKQLNKHGFEYEPDNTGHSTDTAVLIDYIPECTNISTGGFDAHTVKECVDISFVSDLANACSKIPWEQLPTCRKIVNWVQKDVSHRDTEQVNRAIQLMRMYGKIHTNPRLYTSGHTDTLEFNSWADYHPATLTLGKTILLTDHEKPHAMKSLEEVNLYLRHKYGARVHLLDNGLTPIRGRRIRLPDSKRSQTVQAYVEEFKQLNPDGKARRFKGDRKGFKDRFGMQLNRNEVVEYLEQRLTASSPEFAL